MEIEGKTFLVTGGARGMGRCFTMELAKLGANVVFCDINQEGIEAVEAECVGFPGRVVGMVLNLAEEDRVGLAPPSFGSVYPCVQNVLLGCRAKGLGASLTTMHQVFEQELLEKLGIPDTHGIVAVIPIGYPEGNFGPVTRKPSVELTYYDRWGQGSDKNGVNT